FKYIAVLGSERRVMIFFLKATKTKAPGVQRSLGALTNFVLEKIISKSRVSIIFETACRQEDFSSDGMYLEHLVLMTVPSAKSLKPSCSAMNLSSPLVRLSALSVDALRGGFTKNRTVKSKNNFMTSNCFS